jgi:dTDP-4-dehydrorhamnose 3,5-epimerase-like enzyme
MMQEEGLHKKNEASIINLPKILDARGNLSYIEELNHIDFKICRCYWIYDVPGGEIRGGHAFYKTEEFIVALSGSFDVVLDNGIEKVVYHLNRSYSGLFIPRMYWRELRNFSTNSLAFVLSSTFYNPEDYIRVYDKFMAVVEPQ